MNKYFRETIQRYPNLTIQDLIKFLYQSNLGSGHLINNIEDNYQYLLHEYQTIQYDENHILFEEISDQLVRVHLEAIEEKYLKLFHNLFMKSVEITNTKDKLIQDFNELEQALLNQQLPFDIEEWQKQIQEYKDKGCPMISHSPSFREQYHPHYRLMKKEYCKYIELIKKIYDQNYSVIAIDGMSGSGKSTLSNLLHELFDYEIIHMDDFFLQKHQRTSAREAEIGGNIDYERFIEEVVLPIKSKNEIHYQIFDCMQMCLTETKNISSNRILIEGCYSHHPKFENYADLKVFLEISEEKQKERILTRNGEWLLKRFIQEWIPKENAYYKHMHIKENADMIFYED